MALHVLSARQVNTAGIGDHADGGGLFLRVSATGSSWVLRFTAPDGRRREMGLGPAVRSTLAAAGESVAAARKAADKARALLAEGIDSIECRKSDREAAQAETLARKVTQKAERTTLARVARRYHEEVIEPQRAAKHSAQWIASLEQNVPPVLWQAPIDSIEAAPLLDALPFADVPGFFAALRLQPGAAGAESRVTMKSRQSSPNRKQRKRLTYTH